MGGRLGAVDHLERAVVVEVEAVGIPTRTAGDAELVRADRVGREAELEAVAQSAVEGVEGHPEVLRGGRLAVLRVGAVEQLLDRAAEPGGQRRRAPPRSPAGLNVLRLHGASPVVAQRGIPRNRSRTTARASAAPTPVSR